MKSSDCTKKLSRIRKWAESCQSDLTRTQAILAKALRMETPGDIRHEIRRALDLLSVHEEER